MQTEPGVSSQRPSLIIPFILLGIGLALIGVAAFYILQEAQAQTRPDEFSTIPAEVEYPAPGLTLADTGGISHSLAEYRGHVVLVNLWATWCPPCKEEMPTLEAFYQEHKEEGFVIVAVNDGDPAADVIQFVKDYRLTFPVWLDPEYIATEQAFKTLNLPSSFVIDRKGIVRLQWVGGISRKMLDKYVPKIIEE